ncbi:MAG: hypothetical protein LC777_20440, partial [Actinobacteria bacterium]|nr:hypothetical protein [Actinomycetota bacterium]
MGLRPPDSGRRPFRLLSRSDRRWRRHHASHHSPAITEKSRNSRTRASQRNIQDAANTPLRQMLRSLAQRNLLRGYLLSIPTGQAVA